MSTSTLISAANKREKILVRLNSISYATKDINVYELARPDGGTLPPITAGSHIDVHLPNGITRSYSLVHPGESLDRYIVAVKLDPNSRGGSSYIHKHLRVGMTMAVSMPRNHFPLIENAPHTVLIAGGIGITPIWCMAQQLEAAGASWEMWYACRSRADMAFQPELARFGDRVHFHSDEDVQAVLDMALIVAAAPSDSHFYCCGPAPMLTAYEVATSGRAPETVHLERFGAAQNLNASQDTFIVELARAGIELVVPAESTLLDVLTSNGINIDSSCQAGICGCCEVAVLEGEVDHRDEVLTESQRASHKSMMACCSRGKSARLILDL